MNTTTVHRAGIVGPAERPILVITARPYFDDLNFNIVEGTAWVRRTGLRQKMLTSAQLVAGLVNGYRLTWTEAEAVVTELYRRGEVEVWGRRL